MAAPSAAAEDLEPSVMERTVVHDPETAETICTIASDVTAEGEPELERIAEIDLEMGHGVIERFRIREDDPLSARAEIVHKVVTRRAGWSIRVETRSRLSATRDAFRLEAELTARENGRTIFDRRWDRSIPRDHV